MDIFLNMGIGNKLDAINAVLRSIGTVGVNSMEDVEWNIDASEADKTIDYVSQNVQVNRGKGWWFNREGFHKLQPDPVTGYVSVPSNALSVTVKRRNGQPLPVSFRDGKLFDAMHSGYDMRLMTMQDGLVHCEIVVLLDFEALPAGAQQLVTDSARFMFVTEKEGDRTKMEAINSDRERSFISLQSEDLAQRRHNMYQNSRIKQATHYAGGFNNN